MALDTALCATLGIDHPVVQAPVGSVSTPELAAAVSNADETVARTPTGEPVERYDDLPPLAGMGGDVDALPHYAGQSVGLADEVRSAGAVVGDLVDEAVAAISGAAGSITE